MTFTRKKLGPVIGLGLSLSLLAACSDGSAANHAASQSSPSMSTSADSSSSASTSPNGTSGDEAGSGAAATDSTQSGAGDEDHSNESLAQRWARKKNRSSGQDVSRIGESGSSGVDNNSELNAGKTPTDRRGNDNASRFEITPETALARGESDMPIPPAKTPGENFTPAKDDPASKPAAPKPAQDNTDGGKNGTIVAAPEPKKPSDHRGDSGKPGKKPGKPGDSGRTPSNPKPNQPSDSGKTKTVKFTAFDEEGYNSALAAWKKDRDNAARAVDRENAALNDARRKAEDARARANDSRQAYEAEKAKLDELVAAMPSTGDLAEKREAARVRKEEASKAAADLEAAEKKVAEAEKKKQEADRELESATKQLETLTTKREKVAKGSDVALLQMSEEDRLRVLSDALAERVNDYRVKNGLNELVYVPIFNDKAATWSEIMAKGKEAKHSNKDEIGYNGENIVSATCSTDTSTVDECADTLFQKWYESDTDNAHMLEETYSHAGMGLANGADGEVYGTNMFFLKDDAQEKNSTTVVPKSKGMPENLEGEYVPEGAVAVTGGTKLNPQIDDRNTTDYENWEGGKEGRDSSKGVRRGVDERISYLEEAPRIDELKDLDSEISETRTKIDEAETSADKHAQELSEAESAKGQAEQKNAEATEASNKAQAELEVAEAAASDAEKARKDQQAKADKQAEVVGIAKSKADTDDEAASKAEAEQADAQKKADEAAKNLGHIEGKQPTEDAYTHTYEIPAE